jgi:Tol biopolymer transport system component
VLLTGVLLLLTGCGDSDDGSPPEATAAIASPAAGATLAPGDARFLLARRNVIEDITLSGQQRGVLALEEKVRILDLSLSPDGSQLAFVVELPAYTNEGGQLDFGADLYVSGADGSNPHRLLEHETVGDYFERPIWLNESTLLVGWRGFDASGSFSRIETVNTDGGEHEVVLNDAAIGDLSPDRTSIVYTTIDPKTRVQRLVIEALATDDEPRILVDENAGLALFSAVAFSPDGSQLAFAAVDLGGAVPPPKPPSPHGSRSAYETVDVTTHPFAQDVWLIDPRDGSGLHRAADIAENMPSVSWSGDGSSLYVFGPGFLWRLSPASGEAEQLRETAEPGAIVWLDGS